MSYGKGGGKLAFFKILQKSTGTKNGGIWLRAKTGRHKFKCDLECDFQKHTG